MSVQLKELLEKIKAEGVREAEQQADQVRKEAERKASQIVSNAKQEAAAHLEKAKAEAGQFEDASKEAIKQAGRDLVLSVKSEIKRLVEVILLAEIREALDSQFLKDALITLLQAWGKERGEEIQIQLPEKTAEDIRQYILSKLKAEVKKGVEIFPSAQIGAGFRIAEKDGSAYYDLTDRGLAEYLMAYLNPRITELLAEGES
jgi:V/A-type H+-transporting ATPase subunit E